MKVVLKYIFKHYSVINIIIEIAVINFYIIIRIINFIADYQPNPVMSQSFQGEMYDPNSIESRAHSNRNSQVIYQNVGK